MIATLPMYDRPETRAANDRFYTLFRESLSKSPPELSRDETHWLNPDLLLSQTCSLPYRAILHNDVRLVATPVHDLPCPAGYYYSVLIARADDDRRDLADYHQSTLAINSPVSQSGWGAMDQVARQKDVSFERVIETGSHQKSAEAVAEGDADIAAIDAVCWTMITRWDAFAPNLRVIDETPPSPALPYITAVQNNPAPLQDALLTAVRGLSEEDRQTLCLIDITYIQPSEYLAMHIPPAPHISAGVV